MLWVRGRMRLKVVVEDRQDGKRPARREMQACLRRTIKPSTSKRCSLQAEFFSHAS